MEEPGGQEPDVTGPKCLTKEHGLSLVSLRLHTQWAPSVFFNFSIPVREKAYNEDREGGEGGKSLNLGNQKTFICGINFNCKCYFCSPAGGQRQSTAIPQPLSRCCEVPACQASSHGDQMTGACLEPGASCGHLEIQLPPPVTRSGQDTIQGLPKASSLAGYLNGFRLRAGGGGLDHPGTRMWFLHSRCYVLVI